MKFFAVLALAASVAVADPYFSIKFEEFTPQWPKINATESNIPESPRSQLEALEGLTENPDGAVFDEVPGGVVGPSSTG